VRRSFSWYRAGVSGIESPILLTPDAPNYFADAWEARRYIDEELHRTLPRECGSCQGRGVTYLNEIEFKAFVTNQAMARYCKECQATTTWKQASREAVNKPELSPVASRPAIEDRRKEVRSNVSLTACIRQAQSQEEVVVCENISHGGLSFRSKNRYLSGIRIEVAIPYSATTANIFVPAWIVYSQVKRELLSARCIVSNLRRRSKESCFRRFLVLSMRLFEMP